MSQTLSRWDSREMLDRFAGAQRTEIGALAGMLAEPPATVHATALKN